MLAKMIDKIVSLKETKIFEIDGQTYADASLTRIPPHVDRPDCISVSGLDSICKLIRTELEKVGTTIMVQVKSNDTVEVMTTYLSDFSRNTLYRAKADAPGLRTGFRGREVALIELRSLCIPNEGTAYLLDLLSRMTNENSVSTNDNGVTQTVEARQGVALNAVVEIKPRVMLRPFRTFLEVEQPESEFLLRVDPDEGIGFFEADGGIWKLEAKKNIADYFLKNMGDLIDVVPFGCGMPETHLMQDWSDRMLDLILNGPTINGIKKDEVRAMLRETYTALKQYEKIGPMASPFINDPTAIVARAFSELYPGVEYVAQYVPDLRDETNGTAYGLTVFPDDGNTPIVCISAEAPISAAPELLAHELAHVATPEDTEHGESWSAASEAIFKKYNELLDTMIPDEPEPILSPHQPGDGGILTMPLRDNVPEPPTDDWQLTTCPVCGAECWQTDTARRILALEPDVRTACTACALKGLGK